MESRAELTNTVHITSCDRVLTIYTTNYTTQQRYTTIPPCQRCQRDNVDVIGNPGPEALLRCVCNLWLLRSPDLINIGLEVDLRGVLTHQNVYHALDLRDAYRASSEPCFLGALRRRARGSV